MDLHCYHYAPHLGHKIISLLLLPFSALYGLIATLKRLAPRILYGKQGRDFGVPIISVGNLIAGGSGKTPFTIALCKHLCAFGYEHITIVSRGYKRQSRGLVWVSKQGVVLAGVAASGDEPYLIATALAGQSVSVLVCKNRAKAIEEAKAQGAKLVLLDDGLRFCFKKFDVILRQDLEPFYPYFLPSGLYRESYSLYRKLADSPSAKIVRENRDFTREVRLTNPSPKMFLISAIANPTRLLAFLPPILADSSLGSSAHSADGSRIIGSRFFPDHHHFSHKEICAILESYAPTSLLTTQKDATKLQDFSQILSIMELTLHIHPSVLCVLRAYVNEIDSSQKAREKGACIADYIYTPLHQSPQNPASQSPLQALHTIEQKLFASLTRFTHKLDSSYKSSIIDSSPQATQPSSYHTSILLAWVWLPCDSISVQSGLLDEALGILENAFCDGLVDFWLDDCLHTNLSTQAPRQSLAQSFPHKSSAWHYLFDALFLPLRAYFKGDSSGLANSLELESSAPNKPLDLSWDSPELFSLTTLRIGLTKRGWEYCAHLMPIYPRTLARD